MGHSRIWKWFFFAFCIIKSGLKKKFYKERKLLIFWGHFLFLSTRLTSFLDKISEGIDDDILFLFVKKKVFCEHEKTGFFVCVLLKHNSKNVKFDILFVLFFWKGIFSPVNFASRFSFIHNISTPVCTWWEILVVYGIRFYLMQLISMLFLGGILKGFRKVK